MRIRIIISCGLLLLLLSNTIVNGMETPPFYVDKNNLSSDFSFIRVISVHIHAPKTEEDYFTIIMMPKNGHKPENFLGVLQVEDQKGLVVQAQVCPHKSVNKDVSFEFVISTNYLSSSNFKLLEQRYKIEDNPTTYQLKLGTFIETEQ